MTNWRFALTRRWLAYLAAAIVFAIACVMLSNWQLNRAHETAAENARIARNYDSEPVPLARALPGLDSYRPSQEWLRVTMRGTYLASARLLVRNRPLTGNPGYEVLTPLRLADGSIFIIDRGWIPAGATADAPGAVPAPPSGQVTVTARLKAGEGRLANKSAPPGQIATIELDDIARTLGSAVHTGAYGLLDTEQPAPPESPRQLPRPLEDVGLHWSYMIQWLIFAVIGFFGLGYAVRQEYRRLNSADPGVRRAAAERERRRARRQPTDAEAEDEALERAGR